MAIATRSTDCLVISYKLQKIYFVKLKRNGEGAERYKRNSAGDDPLIIIMEGGRNTPQPLQKGGAGTKEKEKGNRPIQANAFRFPLLHRGRNKGGPTPCQ